MGRLLVVDDEVDVREFVANFFRKRDIEVATACSGKEALTLLEAQPPDLILLDIQMPDMDGIAALRLIRQKDRDVKVIMVTGKGPEDEGALRRCREFGVEDYINKPLELHQLEIKVMKTLGRAHGPDKR